MVVYPAGAGTRQNGLSSLVRLRFIPLARGTPVFANLWTIAIRFIPLAREHGRTEYKAVYLLGLSRWRGNTGSATAAPMTTSVYPRWRGNTKYW
ncbi:hypothetical protein K7G95_09745 [Escherichia coli]|nr:hypothetical protein K7G95_09745 [Escherichia coli]